MAYSFRTRLSKRIAYATKALTPPENEEPASSSEDLSDDVKAKLTLDDQDEQPLIQKGDVSTTPPPERRPRASRDATRDTIPPQSLLDRYKTRSAKASVTTLKSNATSSSSRQNKETSFNESFDDASAKPSSEWVDAPAAPNESDKEFQVHGGVEFEMMGKKTKASEPPAAKPADEDFVYERRATRSQTRRQSRADSADTTNIGKDAIKDNNNLAPSSLTVKKVTDKDNSRTTPPPPSKLASPTPSNSPSYTLTSNASLDQANNNQNRHSLSPDPLTTTPAPTSSLRRQLPPTPTTAETPPTPVLPPLFSPNIRPEHIWTSPLANTSRPEHPWGWLKAWTCCRCAHLDPHRRDRPAETMVEQRVCARLGCGHVRCLSGCRMVRDARFDFE